MPTVQMNKRFGLQKLKKIADKDARWTVSPHIVLTDPEQFRLARTKGMPRLLIRTDEVGKMYKHLSWDDVPRYEVTPDKVANNPRLLWMQVRKDLRNTGLKTNRSYENLAWRIKYIMHPTRPRGDIKTFGIIKISKEAPNQVIIKLITGHADENNVYHRKQVDRIVEFVMKGKNLERSTQLGTSLNPELLRNLKAFIEKGINTHQIKPGRTQEISFLTWKDNPTKPEFFDLIEERKRPDKKIVGDIKF